MSSYSVYLVKGTNLAGAEQVLGNAETVEGSDWIRCNFQREANPPHDEVLVGDASVTQTLSKTLGEVVFIFGDTSVDGFVYEHSCDGEIVRKLVWFPMLDDDWNHGWLCAEGEPEAWESSLFGDNKLERYLTSERYRFEDEGKVDEYEEYAEGVREDWTSLRVARGHTYPECDGTVAMLVERHYGVEQRG